MIAENNVSSVQLRWFPAIHVIGVGYLLPSIEWVVMSLLGRLIPGCMLPLVLKISRH